MGVGYGDTVGQRCICASTHVFAGRVLLARLTSPASDSRERLAASASKNHFTNASGATGTLSMKRAFTKSSVRPELFMIFRQVA